MLDRLILGVSKLTDPAGSGSFNQPVACLCAQRACSGCRYPKAEAERYLNLVQGKFSLGPCPISTPGIHGGNKLVKANKSLRKQGR